MADDLRTLTPAETLQAALDWSTPDERRDPAWCAEVTQRVLEAGRAAQLRAAITPRTGLAQPQRPDDPAELARRLDALLAAAQAEAATLDDTDEDDALMAIADAVGVSSDLPNSAIVAAVRAALNEPAAPRPAPVRHLYPARFGHEYLVTEAGDGTRGWTPEQRAARRHLADGTD